MNQTNIVEINKEKYAITLSGKDSKDIANRLHKVILYLSDLIYLGRVFGSILQSEEEQFRDVDTILWEHVKDLEPNVKSTSKVLQAYYDRRQVVYDNYENATESLPEEYSQAKDRIWQRIDEITDNKMQIRLA